MAADMSQLRVELSDFQLRPIGSSVFNVGGTPKDLDPRKKTSGNGFVLRGNISRESMGIIVLAGSQKFVAHSTEQGLTEHNFNEFEPTWVDSADNVDSLKDKQVTIYVQVNKTKPIITSSKNLHMYTRMYRKALKILNRYSVPLGTISIDLHTLATGPEQHDLRVAIDEPNGSEFRLSFRSKVTEARESSFRFSELSLQIDSNVPPGIFSRTCVVRFNVGTCPSEHETINLADIRLFRALSFTETKKYAVKSTLEKLVNSYLKLYVLSETGDLVAVSDVYLFDYVYALYGRETSVMTDLKRSTSEETCGVLSLKLAVLNSPRLAQIGGGSHLDSGVYGGRPLIYGVEMPGSSPNSAFRGSEPFSNPSPWVDVVDSFGYKSYYSTETGKWSWFSPNDPLFDTQNSGSRYALFESNKDRPVWIHPQAQKIDLPDENISGLPSEVGQESRIDGDKQFQRDASRITSRGIQEGAAGQPSSKIGNGGRESSRNVGIDPTSVLASTNPKALEQQPTLANSSYEFRWSRLDGMENGTCMQAGPAVEGATLVPMFGGLLQMKFGGRGRFMRSDDVWVFDSEEFMWKELKVEGLAPVPRTGHCASPLAGGTKMLVFGGSSNQGRLNDLTVLDAENNRWIPVTPSTPAGPSPRARMGMDVLDNGNQCLIFGGREGYRFLGDRYFNDLFMFDAHKMEWLLMKPRAGPIPDHRAGHSVKVINGRHLMVYGGLQDSVKYYGDTWIFDPVSGVWVQPPYASEAAPAPREAHAICRFTDNQIVVYGGQADSGAYLNDLHLFDCSSMQWRPTPVLTGASPGARLGAAMSQVNDRCMIIFGGDVGFIYQHDSHLLELAGSNCRTQASSVLHRWVSGAEEKDTCVVCLDRKKDCATFGVGIAAAVKSAASASCTVLYVGGESLVTRKLSVGLRPRSSQLECIYI
eukprot:CAMPEP_0184742528 /NCGR_PEP_ID=MMETSP0315-20130426/5459_1 /TAXON_ID=101924 /ORGANISM="Rhodosorus marinus, Strain UTEX LB 2760" /LENGTH=925 /DNA_ID=CAMNT_0027213375 /DNA_START=246 /DNA_END=3024 /DNA_ORIENTATION=+